MLTYESFIADFKSKILNILIELKSQNLIIEQIVTLKVLNVLESSFFIYLIVLMKSARKENKFSFLTSLFQNLANEENHQCAENVINFIKKETEINRNYQSENNKRRDKKDENKKNDSHGSNDDKKCTKCDRVSHSKKKCSTINSECFDCHKIDHWKQQCKIKNKKQDNQFKSFRKNDKIEDVLNTEEITLMIKRLINENESFESSELLINSVNDHIIRKILDSKTIDHIFCNRSSFIS
jgi:hypothetical protein